MPCVAIEYDFFATIDSVDCYICSFICATQVLRRTVTVYEGDKAGKLQQVVSEEVPQRVFTFQELKLLAMLSNFSITRTFGEMDVESSLSDEEAARMVIVLKRI